MPALDGDLAGNQQRSLLIAVVDDLEQVAACAAERNRKVA
jgi:hypothetical protein